MFNHVIIHYFIVTFDILFCSISVGETQETNVTVENTEDILVDDKNSEMSVVIREWPVNTNNSLTSNPKQIPPNFTQPISCDFQALPIDDKFFLQ